MMSAVSCNETDEVGQEGIACPDRIYDKIACLDVARKSPRVNMKRAARRSVLAVRRNQDMAMGETRDKRGRILRSDSQDPGGR